MHVITTGCTHLKKEEEENNHHILDYIIKMQLTDWKWNLKKKKEA